MNSMRLRATGAGYFVLHIYGQPSAHAQREDATISVSVRAYVRVWL